MNQNRNDFHHSTFYHSFFEGYTEARVKKENQKGTKIIRIYSADYICQDTEDSKWWIYKFLYLILFVLQSTVYFEAVSQDAGCNFAISTSIAVAIVTICEMIFAAISLCRFFSHRNMTRWEYKVSKDYFQKICGATLVGQIITAVGGVAYVVLNGFPDIQKNLLIIGLVVISGCINGVNYLLEHHTPYELVKNKNQIPEEGNEIW